MQPRERFPALLKVVLSLGLAVTLMPAHAWAGPKYRVLHAFGAGGGLYGSLVLDADGDLYGESWGGGLYNNGTVFELSPSGNGRWEKRVLHSFNWRTDGDFPSGGLIFDTAGNLYGTTSSGGANRAGTVFELKPGSRGWTFSVLYNSGSGAGLVLDGAGDLYGTSGGGGKYGNGAAFELTPSSDGWTENVLYSFCPKTPCVDGDTPYAGLTWDATGNLYGTTELGGKGAQDYGTAFELKHKPDGSWQHLLLHSFPSFPGDGEVVYAGLVFDQRGNLYGATNSGGGNACGVGTCGTVFKLSQDAHGHWKETLLYRFPKFYDGTSPGASLVFDKAGNLFGTAALGGINACPNGCGVVFKLTPGANGTWKYSVVHRFNFQDGANPADALIFDSQGNLYGTTTLGGAGGYGVVFEITP